MLLDLNLGRGVSNITILETSSGKNQNLSFGPFSHGHRIHAIEIPAGNYQLGSVSVPLYDLPFRYDYSKYKNLSIQVKRGETAYFGQIVLGEDRGVKSLDIRVVNRLVTVLPSIQRELAPILQQFPLRVAGPNADLFFKNFMQAHK